MQKRLIYFLISLLLLASSSAKTSAQIIFENHKSKRIANYTIDVTLDTEHKMLTGKMHLTWKNPSRDTVSELRFHSYMNAFSNSESTFMKEAAYIDIDALEKDDWAYLQLDRFRVSEGENLIRKYQYISPDDNNEADRTVFSVDLEEPVLPGKSISLEIEYTVKLPRIFARTGYYENFFMVGQWFPKIGVYENGTWNCHQFHANSEFYSNFGLYEVNINLPKEYLTGATGVLIKTTEHKNGTKTMHYRAEDVVDFAWTASNNFTVVETEYKETAIRLMLQPEHLNQSNRYLSSLKIALDYFTEKLGPYPYPVLTLVDPPLGALAAGGMEYPGFITGVSFKYMPKGFRATERVTIHEFGHQYFMAILASDEFREAWLDEGLNSYFETRIMDETYGANTSVIDFWGFTLGDTDFHRSGYANHPFSDLTKVNQYAWDFPSGSYSVMNYNKPASFLTGLERMLGTECMDNIFKRYYEKYKFKHPKTQDFVNTAIETAAKQKDNIYSEYPAQFFEQFLNTTAVCDYAVKAVKQKKETPYTGFFGNDKKFEKKPETGNYLTEIILERKGDFITPVEIEMVFDNGDTLQKVWNGKSKLKNYKFLGTAKLISVEIDPDDKVYFDINHNNNSYTLKPETAGIRKYVLKVLFWLQNIMQFTTFF
jgi:aminopeptidase N